MTAPLLRSRRGARHAKVAAALLFLSCAGSAVAAIDCSVSSSGVAFGQYDVTQPGADDGTGTLHVTCSRQAGVDPSTVSHVLSLGTGTSGSFTMRRMTSGTNWLNYNLFANAARTQVWGDGTSETVTVPGSISFTASQTSRSTNHSIYGRIPGQQSVRAGTYSDTIVVTITF